jgi:PleD family two-component response regulator
MHQILEQQPFFNQLNIELNRAERYRFFVSMLVYDFSAKPEKVEEQNKLMSEELMNNIANDLRTIDIVSSLESGKLALLFPETNRQGAEVVSKRVSEIIKHHISDKYNNDIDNLITPEMSSYPDAAGAKSIKDFISEYSQ